MPARDHPGSRLEGCSDEVLGMPFALLGVTPETSRTGAGLRKLVRGWLPFALMSAMACRICLEHNKLFRRYELHDALAAFLNAALLVAVLFYVSPLTYPTTSLPGPIFGLRNAPLIAEGQFLMLICSTGIIPIVGAFVLLHGHARGRRGASGLSSQEEISGHFGHWEHLLTVVVGRVPVSIALAAGHAARAGAARLVSVLLGPLHGRNGYRLAKTLEAADRAA